MANVLLVDDDLDLAEVLTDFLVLDGHDVRVAHDGRQGLARLAEEPKPDVILLDVDMPILSGPGMALEILVRDAGLEQIPIVLLSGAADLQEIAGQVGTPYALTKPSDPATLRETVARALRERTPPLPPRNP